MLGKSVALSPADRVLAPPSLDDGPPKDLQESAIAKMDEESKGPHPMTNPTFEFPVRIYVGGKERPGYGRGNKWFVPLRKGETYEVYVENRSGQPVCMRLLVDGLNTLPDLEMAKTKGVATFVWGQHVSLEDARHYVLDPAKQRGPRKIWRVSGFITETGENGKLREFVVGSAEESLAAKRKFTDQMGLITAAFFDPVAKSRGIGTMAGRERPEPLPEDADYTPGNLRAVVHIYYGAPAEPAPSQAPQAPPPAQPGPARP